MKIFKRCVHFCKAQNVGYHFLFFVILESKDKQKRYLFKFSDISGVYVSLSDQRSRENKRCCVTWFVKFCHMATRKLFIQQESRAGSWHTFPWRNTSQVCQCINWHYGVKFHFTNITVNLKSPFPIALWKLDIFQLWVELVHPPSTCLVLLIFL